MIVETENMLEHVEFSKINFNILDRPDLRHTYYSMIYLPYRICEDCYLLFETLNDIKDYQIELANLMRIPVDKVNFCFNYYKKLIEDKSKVKLTEDQIINIEKIHKDIDIGIIPEKKPEKNPEEKELNNFSMQQKIDGTSNTQNLDSKNGFNESFNKSPKKTMMKNNSTGELHKEKPKENQKLNLYRILVMFNDLIWNELVEIPNEDLYILYSFLGNKYKIPLKIDKRTRDLDYSIINFKKIYHIVCSEPDGFISLVDKNRYMEVKIGTFEKTEEEKKKNEIKKLLKNQIEIQDQDICGESEVFKPYAALDLSIQGLKYGTNYRNNLNGLLFKKDKPYFIGKLKLNFLFIKKNKKFILNLNIIFLIKNNN
jgi:hypothetical protein